MSMFTQAAAAFASLPVVREADRLLRELATAAVLIFVSPPGSGKTVGLPRLVNTRLRRRVYVAVPRRVAAVGAAKFTAAVYGEDVGERVGFQIGGQREAGSDTQVIYVTYGILIRRLLGGWIPDGVVVLDEIHEWSVEQELALGLTRRLIEQGKELQVVVMSATLDGTTVSSFFGGARVVELPGKIFPIEDRDSADLSPERWAVKLAAEEGRSVIVFQPGKREIADSVESIRRELGGNKDIAVFQLHGEMDLAEQRRAIDYAGRKIVVATNIAEASVTINGVSAVVDTGSERRSFESGGATELRLVSTSRAQREQRRGRAGRQMPGVFIDCCPEALDSRPEYPTPEIFRKGIEEVVLQVRAMGLNLRTLPLVHAPTHEDLEAAEKLLKILGLVDADGSVTEAGRFAAKLPVDVRVAGMLWAARERGVLSPAIVAAALLEEDGVLDRKVQHSFSLKEVDSDLLMQMEIYFLGKGMKPEIRRGHGIHGKAFDRVAERIRDLSKVLGASASPLVPADRNKMVEAIAAGFCDEVYFLGRTGDYTAPHGERRFIVRESLASGKEHAIVVGKQRDAGGARMLTMVTPITVEQLVAAAPHLCMPSEPRNIHTDGSALRAEVTISFLGKELRRKCRDLSTHPRAAELRREFGERTNRAIIDGGLYCPASVIEFSGGAEPDAGVSAVEVGQCVLTGAPLCVFETLALRLRGSDWNNPQFERRRYRTNEEAERAAAEVLAEVRAHVVRLEAKAKAKAEAEARAAQQRAEAEALALVQKQALDAARREAAARETEFTTPGGLNLSGLAQRFGVEIKRPKGEGDKK